MRPRQADHKYSAFHACDSAGECLPVGGDEFVLICFDMDEMIFRSKVRISVTALLLKGSVFLLALSGGSSSELETMLRRADDLMYEEKKKYYEEHGVV